MKVLLKDKNLEGGFGIIEILIGSVTLLSNFVTVLLGVNNKTPNVLLFVVVTGAVSTLIGVGILKLKKSAYQLLLYFSSIIVLSKLLIFLGIIHLNGALETTVPAPIKRMLSVGYHLAIILYLNKPGIKRIFDKESLS